MMLPVELAFSIFIGFSTFQGVASRPSPSSFSINLKRCEPGLANSTATEQCSSICLPIQIAQTSCHGSVACTCSTVPSEVLQKCMECHAESALEGRDSEAIMLIPATVKTYSDLCEGISSTDLPAPREPNPNETPAFDRREADSDLDSVACLFGMPEIMVIQSPTMITISTIAFDYRSPWLLLVFIAICVVSWVGFVRRK